MLASVPVGIATNNAFEDAIFLAASCVNAKIIGYKPGRGISARFKVKPLGNGSEKYRKLSPKIDGNMRKVNAICWHGFRDFFRAVYAEMPDVKFTTGIAVISGEKVPDVVYDGVRNFNVQFPETDRKVTLKGNTYWLSELCECDE